uniref:VE20 n=1 Tax=Enterococcus faecalis TaxID=1351 RepID=C4P4J7_ENTFL|nr:VE20 [Enterococcus faecalis]
MIPTFKAIRSKICQRVIIKITFYPKLIKSKSVFSNTVYIFISNFRIWGDLLKSHNEEHSYPLPLN